MINNIYFQESTKSYFYFSEKNVFCDYCNLIISKTLLFQVCWSKHPKINKACTNCIKETKKEYGIVFESFWCILISEIPENCKPKLILPPIISNAKINNFQAAEIQTIKTIDNTKYADRETWEGSQIGVIDSERIRELDCLPSFDFFKNLVESKPIIEQKTKLLEVEK